MLTWIKSQWKAVAGAVAAALALLGLMRFSRRAKPSPGTAQAQEVLNQVRSDKAVQEYAQELERLNQKANTRLADDTPTDIDLEALVADLRRFREDA